ncbi:HET domain-containing protein [Fusarium keratoplasticum]|nr:HET domain-containing protein [Fusarium keratoplasticum]
MRLLDASSYELTEFPGNNIPPYVILSHTWGEEEVLFPDIQNKTAQSKKGFNKLVSCCQKAAEDGFKWVWIDTCCIDKSSSVELSEAINSMYQWYRDSTICYAYLEDVTEVFPNPDTDSKHFTESRWFTRGWTLQELIAPRTVEFYTLAWAEIGTKRSLAAQIAIVTGITSRILCGEDVSTCIVAERMSWASQRQTTRREDMAYCLMGLFQINMPLLYGEGDKAFVRLQEEILRQEEDYSILAWTPQGIYGHWDSMGCLAPSPSQFATMIPEKLPLSISSSLETPSLYGNIKSYSHFEGLRAMETKSYECFRKAELNPNITMPKDPPQLTARGLRISLPVRRIDFLGTQDSARWDMLAGIYYEVDGRLVCILLGPVGRAFARMPSPWLMSVHKSSLSEFKLTEVFLLPSSSKTNSGISRLIDVSKISRVRLELSPAAGYSASVVSASLDQLSEQDGFCLNSYPDACIVLWIECKRDGQDTAARFEVGCGIPEANIWSLRIRNPWCSIKEVSGPGTISGAQGLESMFEDLWKMFPNPSRLAQMFGHSTTSDRVAKLSIEIPGMVVSAAIRPRPQTRQGTSQFILRVTVG